MHGVKDENGAENIPRPTPSRLTQSKGDGVRGEVRGEAGLVEARRKWG